MILIHFIFLNHQQIRAGNRDPGVGDRRSGGDVAFLVGVQLHPLLVAAQVLPEGAPPQASAHARAHRRRPRQLPLVIT